MPSYHKFLMDYVLSRMADEPVHTRITLCLALADISGDETVERVPTEMVPASVSK